VAIDWAISSSLGQTNGALDGNFEDANQFVNVTLGTYFFKNCKFKI
jgi:hypothetical protein